MTNHMIDLTRSRKFQIITDFTYLKVDLVINYLTYLTFQINLPIFGLTFQINRLNQSTQLTFLLYW